MTGEQIHSPLSANNRTQAVVAAAQIDRLGGEIDPNTGRQRQHLPSASRSVTTYAGSRPSRRLTRIEPTAAAPSATRRTGSTRGVLAFYSQLRALCRDDT